MALNIFRGDAQDIPQIETLTLDGGLAGNTDTVSIRINLKEVSYTCAGTEANATEIAEAFVSILSESEIAEFREMEWEVGAAAGTIIATSATDGNDFTLTPLVNGSASVDFTTTTTQSAKGSEWWSDPDNWSLSAVPVNSDDVYIPPMSTNIRHGLNQSAVTLGTLTISAGYTGTIGLPIRNESYYEYRATRLAINAANLVVGQDVQGTLTGGSGRIRLNLGSTTCAIQVYNTGTKIDPGYPALDIIGTGSNTLSLQRGSVGFAMIAGEVATVVTSRVGSLDSGSNAELSFGAGCTLTTLNMLGGKVNAYASIATVNMAGGTIVANAAAAFTTITAEGGTLDYRSSGTITTLTLRNDAKVTFENDVRARTLTNTTINGGCEIHDHFKTVTFTNPISINCSIQSIVLDLGSGMSLQRS